MSAKEKAVKQIATILVDFENVSRSDGLKGVEYLNEKDTLIIFYSQCCEKIRAEYIEMIEKSRCGFKIYKLSRTGKNALDFYIAVATDFDFVSDLVAWKNEYLRNLKEKEDKNELSRYWTRNEFCC